MACTLCNATMQNLGVEGQRIFYCPLCGCIKSVVGESVTVPLIASRLRAACDVADRVSIDGKTWVEVIPERVWVGIAESVGENCERNP